MTVQTLATLVTNVRLEAGHSSSASTGLNQRDQIVYIINRVQEELQLDYDFPGLTVDRNVSIVAGTRYYGFPSDLPFDNIDAAWITQSSDYYGLSYGIGPAQFSESDSTAGTQGWPPRRWMHHYDTGQFELWPIPNQSGTALTFRGTVLISWMVADADSCVLPSTVITLFAAAEVLAREGAKDAALKLEKAKAYLRRLRVRQSAHKSKPFVVGGGNGANGGRAGLEYIPLGYGAGPTDALWNDPFTNQFDSDFV